MLLLSPAFAADLSPGVPAPPLTLARVLQAPPGVEASWAALKGQAVVLEFWATWCAGCREAIPHLNRLQQDLAGKPVRFVSITDEDAAVVQAFLKDHPIHGWIGLDQAERTFKDYGILGRPTTVLVDQAGIVRGVGNAIDLTAGILEDLVAGRPVEFTRSSRSPVRLQSAPEPLFQVILRPAAPAAVSGYSPGAMSGKAGARWSGFGMTLASLLATAHALAPDRVRNATTGTWIEQSRFDVSIAAPGLTNESRLRLLRQLLEETFALETRQTAVETDLYVLRRGPGLDLRMTPSAGQSSLAGKLGAIKGVSVPTARLAVLLEQTLKKTVVDETGLEGGFDLALTWDAARPESLVDAVREQLGLELVPARRALVHLEITSARQPAAW